MPTYTKKELNQLADVGCILCHHLGYGLSPSELHHVRRYGEPRNNAPILPLCYLHHRGQFGVHGLGRKGFEKFYSLTENDLLDLLKVYLNNTR